jgi:hypothetical protein
MPRHLVRNAVANMVVKYLDKAIIRYAVKMDKDALSRPAYAEYKEAMEDLRLALRGEKKPG